MDRPSDWKRQKNQKIWEIDKGLAKSSGDTDQEGYLDKTSHESTATMIRLSSRFPSCRVCIRIFGILRSLETNNAWATPAEPAGKGIGSKDPQ
nr:hypothetical protein Iba_chr11bCG3690 [Ipomoea batatas]GMD54709.1 hypothetical protein Iba_chr11dCG0990 [Ipomoea batatas]